MRASRSASPPPCATWSSTWTSITWSRASPTARACARRFREFELRAPLERLEEALGEGTAAAPAERVEEVIRASAREVPVAELGALDGELVAVAALRPGEQPAEAAAPATAEPEDPDAELEAEEEAALAAAVGEDPAVAAAEPATPAAGPARVPSTSTPWTAGR